VQQRDHDAGKKNEHGNRGNQCDRFEGDVAAAEAAKGRSALTFGVDERDISPRDGSVHHLVDPWLVCFGIWPKVREDGTG
jgi:hypothetical protein